MHPMLTKRAMTLLALLAADLGSMAGASTPSMKEPSRSLRKQLKPQRPQRAQRQSARGERFTIWDRDPD